MSLIQTSQSSCVFHFFGGPDGVCRAVAGLVTGLSKAFESRGWKPQQVHEAIEHGHAGQGEPWPAEGHWWRTAVRWTHPAAGMEMETARPEMALREAMRGLAVGEVFGLGVVLNAAHDSAFVISGVSGSAGLAKQSFSVSQTQAWFGGPMRNWEGRNGLPAGSVEAALLDKALLHGSFAPVLNDVVARHLVKTLDRRVAGAPNDRTRSPRL